MGPRIKLFLTCWVLLSLHFATNVVREHYPAMSLVDHGHFQLDEYAGFHSDIFEHEDGHHYIGNQVTGSVFAALPLLVFRPVLDKLQEVGAERAAKAPPDASYDTEYEGRAAFFAKVRKRGLDLKFGAVTAITAALLMAPLTALFGIVLFDVFRRRGVAPERALWLALLGVFGTPVFFRTAHLNHNVFFAYAAFGSFLLLWSPGGTQPPLSSKRRFWAGVLAGLTLALDYAGIITLLALFGYLLWSHVKDRDWRPAARAAPAFVLGSVPPVVFLLWSQWIMYGNAFLPGQFHMPDQNIYVGEGARGMTAPDMGLFVRNLVDLDWGLFTWAPLLVIALLPLRRKGESPGVLPRGERWFVGWFALAFLLFCACNQYSRLQWNTGFRYLLVLVPFLYLVVADHLAGASRSLLTWITIPVVLHSWVLCMYRYTPPVRGDAQAIPENWSRFLEHGVQFPWLSVVQRTPSLPIDFLRTAWAPYALLALVGAAIALIWRVPGRPPPDAP